MDLVKNLDENAQTSTIFRLIRGKPGANATRAIQGDMVARTGTVKTHPLIRNDPAITLGGMAIFYGDTFTRIEGIAMGNRID